MTEVTPSQYLVVHLCVLLEGLITSHAEEERTKNTFRPAKKNDKNYDENNDNKKNHNKNKQKRNNKSKSDKSKDKKHAEA